MTPPLTAGQPAASSPRSPTPADPSSPVAIWRTNWNEFSRSASWIEKFEKKMAQVGWKIFWKNKKSKINQSINQSECVLLCYCFRIGIGFSSPHCLAVGHAHGRHMAGNEPTSGLQAVARVSAGRLRERRADAERLGPRTAPALPHLQPQQTDLRRHGAQASVLYGKRRRPQPRQLITVVVFYCSTHAWYTGKKWFF